MASHGGQLTFAQKKMLSMQAQAESSSLASSLYSAGPQTAAVRQESVPFHSDVEMRDASAATSTDGSAPVNPSHARVQSNFSAVAKPFTPPGSAIPISPTMAPPVTSIIAPTVNSTMAPPVTPAKRAPPHRASKDQTPVAPIVAPKSDFPVTPAVGDHSAAPSPKRRAGPHSKLGPHVQRNPGSLSTVSIGPASPAQVKAQVQAQDSVTSQATTPASTTQDAWVDVQQLKSEPEAWIHLQEPQVEMDVEQPSARQVDMETEQSLMQSTPVASAQNWGTPAVVQSTPVISPRDWATPAAVEHEQSATQAMSPQQMSASEAVLELPTPGAVPHSPQEQAEAQAEPTDFALSEETSTSATTTRRYGRNEYLSMLLDMTDTAKGREVIRAFADHIHAAGDTSMREVATPDTQQEIWMEFRGGQHLAATVPQNTTLINAIKEFAKMTRADQSEIRIILKVGDKDST